MDYIHIHTGGPQEKKKIYGTIKRLILHEGYPGLTPRLIVEGQWWENMGYCPVTNNPLVKRNDDHMFNHSSKFVFLTNCYPRPVAIWPHDPLDDFDENDERKIWFDVIDRNQEEMY